MPWAFSDNYQLGNYETPNTYIGSVRTNATSAGGNLNVAAFDYFSDAAVDGDYLYLAYSKVFFGVRFTVGTAFAAAAVTFNWEYYTGSAWAALTVSNGSALLSVGTQDVTWTPPTGWKGVSADAGGYAVRCRLSGTSGVTEGGANATTAIKFNFKALVVTGTVTGLDSAVTADVAGGWNVITNPAPNLYVLNAHLCVGDGSTATTFTLNATTVSFGYGLHWWVNVATFNCGVVSGSGASEGSTYGSIFMEGVNFYSFTQYWVRSFGTSTVTMRGCRFVFLGNGYINTSLFVLKTSGTLSFYDCVFAVNGSTYIYLTVVTAVAFVRCTFGVQLSVLVSTATFTNCRSPIAIRAEASGVIVLDGIIAPSCDTWINSDAARIDCIDADTVFTVGYSGMAISTDSIRHLWRFDLTVQDQAGSAIEAASVVITDALGATVFSGSTDANGQIAQQQLKQKVADHGSGSLVFSYTNHTPHVVTISKSGYADYVMVVPMTKKRDELVVMSSGGVIVIED